MNLTRLRDYCLSMDGFTYVTVRLTLKQNLHLRARRYTHAGMKADDG